MDMGHDHDGMDMGGNQCSMNMIFHWNTSNLCIVFKWWRITGPISLALSLLAIVVLCAGYEAVRDVSRRFEAHHVAQLSTHSVSSSRETESSSLLGSGREERRGNITRALLYAFQVGFSYMLMLIFMTYNGWVMLAVTIGAFVGYMTFGKGLSSTKAAACH